MVGSREAKPRTTKKRRSSATKAKLLRPIPPDQPAARDEGPRLIPLEFSKEPSRLEHYLDLADTALGLKRFGGEAEIRSSEPSLGGNRL